MVAADIFSFLFLFPYILFPFSSFSPTVFILSFCLYHFFLFSHIFGWCLGRVQQRGEGEQQHLTAPRRQEVKLGEEPESPHHSM